MVVYPQLSPDLLLSLHGQSLKYSLHLLIPSIIFLLVIWLQNCNSHLWFGSVLVNLPALLTVSSRSAISVYFTWSSVTFIPLSLFLHIIYMFMYHLSYVFSYNMSPSILYNHNTHTHPMHARAFCPLFFIWTDVQELLDFFSY